MTTAQKLLTAEDLLAMPDDGRRCELIRGELIEMPPASVLHGIVTGRIGYRISSFIEERGLRFVYGPEIGIFLGQGPDTVRAADFCVIAAARMTSPLPERGYVPGLVPDLVVEVIAPGYDPAKAAERAQMWRDAGVRLVLMAYIATREIYAHHDDGTARRFGGNDTLTGEPVLPGFACPVVDIFTY